MSRRLAVIPLGSIDECAAKGQAGGLGAYFNPAGFFDEVYIFSPLERKATTFQGLRIYPTRDRELPARLKEFAVDLVRAYGGGWPAEMACCYRSPNVPVVVSLHDRRPETARAVVSLADIVLGVSKETCALACLRGVVPERVWLRPNGVDLALMRPRQCAVVPAGLPVGFSQTILHVGRLSPEKNLGAIITALLSLPSSVNLVVVGPGDPAPYRAEIAFLGLSPRVTFLGAVPNEHLPAYYNAATLVCQPSHSEAMSNVVLEAMACACPLVLSEAAARGLAVTHENEAWVITDVSSGSLAEALKTVLANESLRQGLAERALHAAQRFEAGAMAQLEAGQYARIMEMKDSGLLRLSLRTQVAAAAFRARAWIRRRQCRV